MKKKVIAILLIAMLVCALLPTTALAADTVSDVSTFSFVAGVTTQEDINEKLGEGAIELTSAEVNGETVYTLKLLKNIMMKSGCDFRINEYNVGGMLLPAVILDLNGCTITSDSIGLITGGRLTIEDSVGGGGITYSTTSTSSSLVAISNTGELVINGGTFRCESGYAYIGYVAAVSTQGDGATAVINGGTFYSNSSAVLSSNGGVTTVNGGEFEAPYGLYAKAGSAGAGEIIVPEGSTAVVKASSFALVIQRVNGVDGEITVQGGTFSAPNLVGSVSSPDTEEAVSIEGGAYDMDPQKWVSGETPVAQLTQSGVAGQYLVGQSAIEAAAASLAEGDEIEVLSGSLTLTNLPDGVTVTNSGDGEVTANGETVTDTPVTTHTHEWGEPVFTWNADNTATATFTCEKDSSHQEIVTATISSKVEKEPTCTEKGLTIYYATVEFNGTSYTDSKSVETAALGHAEGVLNGAKEASCTEEGYTGDLICPVCGEVLEEGEVIEKLAHDYKDGVCTVCGAEDPDYVPFTPEITNGADASWQKGSKSDLSFTSNAEYADFQKVQVDGKDVDAANYEVEEGSTIVTLKASYLETLAVGKHTLAIVSASGTASTTFTITEASSSAISTPATGDSDMPLLWAALLMASGGGVLAVTAYSRKRRSSH